MHSTHGHPKGKFACRIEPALSAPKRNLLIPTIHFAHGSQAGAHGTIAGMTGPLTPDRNAPMGAGNEAPLAASLTKFYQNGEIGRRSPLKPSPVCDSADEWTT
jgi:hypothetical protein